MLTCGKRFMKVLSWISVKHWIGSWMPWKLRLCKKRLSKQGRGIDTFPIGVSADSYPLNGP